LYTCDVAVALLRVSFDFFEMAEGDFTGDSNLPPLLAWRCCGLAFSTIGPVPSQFPTSSISLT
jgi:hypothetical protein